MTADNPDKLIYENETYGLVEFDGQGLIKPQDYGMEPARFGDIGLKLFYSIYKIINEQLVLQEMIIYGGQKLQPINGIMPEKGDFNDYIYKNINLLTSFSGNIIAGTGFMPEFFSERGVPDAIAYRVLLEFKFDQGNLIDVKHLSRLNAKNRGNTLVGANSIFDAFKRHIIVDFHGPGLIEPLDYGMESNGFYSTYQIEKKNYFYKKWL